jgi:hypothetical protein
MRHLHAQACRAAIEILLCVPERSVAGGARPEWADFHSVRIIETGPLRIIAEAKAAAVRAAAAPVVVFTEEHSFPAPGWAEALIARHREPHAVVGPVMVNPNPGLPMSWSNFIAEYGPWVAPAEPGLRSHLPGNNSSYKRDILLQYGGRLPVMLDAESLLHQDLLNNGHTLYLESRANTSHFNITRLDAFRRVHHEYGRMFAAQRCRDWNLARRIVYTAGSPLIPLIRLCRHWTDIWRVRGVPRRDPRFWAYLLLALLDSAWGEMKGYSTGAGNSREQIFELEFHRLRYLDPRDHKHLSTGDLPAVCSRSTQP